MFVFISRKTGKKIFTRKKGRIKQFSFIHPFLIYEFPDKKNRSVLPSGNSFLPLNFKNHTIFLFCWLKRIG